MRDEMTDMTGSEDLAIRITGLKKEYRLGMIGGGTLQRDLQSWWARVRGKEDPNLIIGSDQRMVGERFMALNGVDLTVRKGEALGIIGRNGAGKSTLLKILSRITGPTEGTVELWGRVTSMLEVGTGFHGEMTGRENVYMNGAILGMTRAEIDEAMDDIIEFSEIGEFIDTPVKRYSSGMYVKLAFSVASHLKGDIMIMDEVLAVGDMAFQRKCLSAMRDAATSGGRTVLYVSHNMATIRQLCDRCIVLDEGRIVYDGDTDEAIGIYMSGIHEDTLRIDYAGVRDFGWLRNKGINLRSAEFPNRGDASFDDGETMRIRLVFEALRDVEGVAMRLETYTLDEVPQGSHVLFDVFSGKAGDVATLDLDVDVSMLCNSTYYMKYTFFQSDEMGNQQTIECRNGLKFDRVSSHGSKLIWEPRNWGYVRLEGARVASLTIGSGDGSDV